jgi:hypothetical protein
MGGGEYVMLASLIYLPYFGCRMLIQIFGCSIGSLFTAVATQTFKSLNLQPLQK